MDRWPGMVWLVAVQDEARIGAWLALVVAGGAMLFVELRASRRSWPRVLYVLGLVAVVAVALLPRDPFLFLVIWTSQHWLVATALASRTACAEPVPLRGRLRRAAHAVNVRPWAVALMLMAISVVFLPIFEVEATWDGGRAYGDRIFGSFATALGTSTWVPALLALGFASGFLHYLLDRHVYRFSDSRVRTAARGLLQPAIAVAHGGSRKGSEVRSCT